MKRWIAILLAMLLTLTACGSLQEPSAAEPEEVPVETPQIEPEAEKEPIAEEDLKLLLNGLDAVVNERIKAEFGD